VSTKAETTYLVEGMTCGHCERSVREQVEELAGVESVSVDRTTGRLIVGGDVDAAAIRAAVEAAGYEVAR
jgi:copper chaperone